MAKLKTATGVFLLVLAVQMQTPANAATTSKEEEQTTAPRTLKSVPALSVPKAASSSKESDEETSPKRSTTPTRPSTPLKTPTQPTSPRQRSTPATPRIPAKPGTPLSPATSTATIRVLSPNGGETLKQGSKVRIRWTVRGNPGRGDILLQQGPRTIATIGRNVNLAAGNIRWEVRSPSPSGSGLKILIRSSDRRVQDLSDRTFTIAAAE
ncbi:MAG: hypothetical protein P8171_24495 [Candidatus Thiodiazotropha sp.]